MGIVRASNRAMSALKDINELLEYSRKRDKRGIEWGHVGDMERIASKLEEITQPE